MHDFAKVCKFYKGVSVIFPGSDIIYKLMYLVGFVLMMIYSVKFRGRYGISKPVAIGFTIATYVFGVSGALVMGKVYSAISVKVIGEGSSNVAIFGAVIFCPLLLLLLFLMQNLFTGKKNDFRRQMDLLTPGIFMILTCAKFGCSLEGCCYGVAFEHGIYNPKAGMKVFPVQILEVVSMICVLLIARALEKTKRFVPGMKYPVTSILYCTVRFCWEFARYYPSDDLKHLFAGMTFWQLCCIFVILVSVCVIVYLARSQRIKDIEESHNNKKDKFQRKGITL